MTMRRIGSVQILPGQIALATGDNFEPNTEKRTFQAVGSTSAGAGACTVDIQGSNDGINFITMATITLVLAVAQSTDGFASDAPWRFVRAKVTSISGTDAAVSVWMGC